MGDVVDKVRKLLQVSTARGATEGEVANAMAIASKLMLQHNISETDVRQAAVEEDLILGRPEVFGTQHWVSVLGITIASLFNCRHVCDPDTGHHSWAGRQDNVEACLLTMRWTLQQVESLYKVALAEFGGGLSKSARADFRRSFKDAAALRLHVRVQKITAAVRNDIPTHKALTVINQMLAKADEGLKAIGGETKAIAICKSIGSGTGAGWLAGDAVQLQRGVDDKE